jgi:hypothetical protein
MFHDIEQQPDSPLFARNPIIYEVSADAGSVISFDVLINGTVAYSGQRIPVLQGALYRCKMNISSIVSAFLAPYTLTPDNTMLFKLTGGICQVGMVFYQDSDEITTGTQTIYYGGLSASIYRRLLATLPDDVTLMGYRFMKLPRSLQFALTTRTAGRNISIRESEIVPLAFIFISGIEYKIVTEKGYGIVLPAGGLNTYDLVALDIQRIRDIVVANTGSAAPQKLHMLVNDSYVFTINIVPALPARRMLLLEFINSFGIPERVELTGLATSEPEFTADKTYNYYDTVTDSFVERTARVPLRETLLNETGFKTPEEFLFLRDMLQSNSHTLISPDGMRYDVTVSAENFSYELFPIAPQSIRIRIRLADAETMYSSPLDDSDPEYRYGESVWQRGITDAGGFNYQDEELLNNE